MLRLRTGASHQLIQSASPAICTLLAGFAVLLLAFLPGHPYRLEQYDLPKDIALGVMGGVSACLLLFSQDTGRQGRIGFTLAALLGWGLMAAPLLGGNHFLALRTIGLFAAGVSVFVLAQRVGAIGASAKILNGTMLIIGVMCVLVLLEAYGGIPFLSAPGRRPGATLGNRNLAARLACMALPLLWIGLLANHGRALRYVLFAVLPATIAVIVLSRSRGAFVVTCVLAVLLPAASRWHASGQALARWRAAAMAWVAFLVLGIGAVFVLPNRLGWSGSDFASSARRVAEYQTGTGRGRVVQAATTWRMIVENPLWGVGPGNWAVVYPAYAPEDDPSVMRGAFYPGPQVPRNDVLPLVAEWGAIGVVLGIALVAAVGGRITQLLASRHEETQSHGVLALGVAIGATMLGLFDSILRVAPTIVLLALLLGLAFGAGDAEPGLNRADNSRAPRYAWRVAWGVYAVLSLIFARGAMQDFEALRIMNSFATAKDLARAVRIAPNNVEARAVLSYVLVSAGRCDLAMRYLTRAVQLQSHSRFLRSLQERCSRVPERAQGDAHAKRF